MQIDSIISISRSSSSVFTVKSEDMGLFKNSDKAAALAGGEKLLAVSYDIAKQTGTANDLSQVLPVNPKPWYRTKHLLLLNACLLVPFFSTATVGFDGKHSPPNR